MNPLQGLIRRGGLNPAPTSAKITVQRFGNKIVRAVGVSFRRPQSRQGGTSLIPWNGSKALIDFLPPWRDPGTMNRTQGAFDELRKFVLGPSERDPHGPTFHQ